MLTLDVVSFNAAISACEKGKQWEVALALLQEIGNNVLIPDLLSCNAVVSACDKGKQWKGALGLLQEMVH